MLIRYDVNLIFTLIDPAQKNVLKLLILEIGAFLQFTQLALMKIIRKCAGSSIYNEFIEIARLSRGLDLFVSSLLAQINQISLFSSISIGKLHHFLMIFNFTKAHFSFYHLPLISWKSEDARV
jgi:hypothetical protein